MSSATQVTLVLLLLMNRKSCQLVDQLFHMQSGEPVFPASSVTNARLGCAILGFANATLNECGYCVGSETEVPQDFGRDCNGKCGGSALRDCNGVCGGHAFVDECSSERMCLNDSRGIRDWSSRDCRGICTNNQDILPTYLFKKDRCGVCRLPSGPVSPFEDCDGRCFVPGMIPKSLVCSECVSQSAVDELLDGCGNCKSHQIPCPCDREPTRCGCRDKNNCYSLRSVHPVFVPKGLTRSIKLFGYFFPPTKDMQCVFRHEQNGELISTPLRFESMNRSTTVCDVLLAKGMFVFTWILL